MNTNLNVDLEFSDTLGQKEEKSPGLRSQKKATRTLAYHRKAPKVSDTAKSSVRHNSRMMDYSPMGEENDSG